MKCLQEPNYSKRPLSHTAETNIQAEPFYTGFCLLFIMLQHSAFPEKFSYLRMFNFFNRHFPCFLKACRKPFL